MTDIMRWEDMTEAERQAVKVISEESFAGFLRVFFQLLQGQRFLKNWHHTYFCDLGESIYRGERKRVIVNCPPGATKTEIWSIHWPVWCIIQCVLEGRSSRWLPISYSDDLVTENAARAREIIDSEPFQALWPMVASKDTKGKSDWKYKDENGNQHRMFGTSLMGQVTGRRAGFMVDGFTGALVLDDPLPPRDEGHSKKIEKFNKALNRIVRSRLANDDVPIVMIQQRIAKNDSTHFLMSDKSPDVYELHKVPGLIDREYVMSLPEEVQSYLIEDTGFNDERISYWPDKEPTEVLLDIEKSDPYLSASQYQQAPDDAFLEGVIFRKEIDDLIREGRACRLPLERSLPVHTFWDLGINDDMCLWLVQAIGKEIRLIGCYGNNNEGMEHYINWLHDFRDDNRIRFGDHHGPHDLAVRELMSGRSRIETAKQMGLRFKMMERPKLKNESIGATKKLFPRIWIDPERCEKGWDAIKKYRREWDADNEIFKDKPIHDWTSNYADALQQLGLAWRDKTKNPESLAPSIVI